MTVDGNLFVLADFKVFGNKSAAVPHPDGSYRTLYSMESPESWFEDFGRARLVRGRARVRLDRTFAAVVSGGDFHVFLSPEGESRGMYVRRRTRDGFEVREQQGGTSTLGFSCRVVARRKDVAAPRFQRIPPHTLTIVRADPAGPARQPKAPPAPRRPKLSTARRGRSRGKGR